MRVVFIICEHALNTSLSLPLELFEAARTFIKARASNLRAEPDSSRHDIELSLASVDGASKQTHAGLLIQPDSRMEDIQTADLIFVPALWRNPFPVIARNRQICGWLTDMYNNNPNLMIAGVGTGCCFLAEAGLLNQRIATTHWYYFEQFQKRYPKVKLQKNYFITQSGRIYCSGSVNTLADLTVHFIEQFFDSDISSNVESQFFHDIRQSYSKLALLEQSDDLHNDELVAQVQNYLSSSLKQDFDIDTVSSMFDTSRRNLDRRFRKTLGITVHAYLVKLRMDAAKDILKKTDLNISETAHEVGYVDPAHFSALFKKHNGTTPRQYRTVVRAKLFSAN
jgi:transcriptional regulator GlxA family with amidase domain